jgi:hypothetical protein
MDISKIKTCKCFIHRRKIYEIIVNITNHHGNSNPNHNETIVPHPYNNGYYLKELIEQVASKMQIFFIITGDIS